MTKLVQVQEIENEGILKLMGKRVTFFCLNYIYVGELIGISDTCVLISNPAIVYETGAFTEEKYRDEQSLNVPEFFIQKSCIESFGILK